MNRTHRRLFVEVFLVVYYFKVFFYNSMNKNGLLFSLTTQCNSSSFNRRQFFVVQILWCNWVSFFVTQLDSHLLINKKYNWGPKNRMQIDCEKLTFFIVTQNFPTTQAGKCYWSKKIAYQLWLKMEVYCMNWVSLNRRLLDVQ